MKKIMTLSCLLISISVFSQNQFQNETSGTISFTSQKLIQLAEAFSEDKYDWSPDEGVRSVKEVLTHVISANYFFGSKLGGTLPADVDLQNLESSLQAKEDILDQLRKSYAFITETIRNSTDDQLAAKMEFPFPGEYTGMSAALIGLSHTNEHLGQLIAYARSNKIAPPWSEQE